MKLIVVDISSMFWTFAAVSRELNGPFELTLGKIRRFANGFDRLVIVCDGGRSWRVTLDRKYKAGRPAKPAHLVEQLRRVVETLRGEAVVFEAPQWGEDEISGDALCWEADDLAGTVARWAVGRGHVVRVVSEDWDLAQLVAPGVEIQKLDGQVLGPTEVEAVKGVPPSRIVDLKALAGDASDGYKPYPGERAGKKGIGEGVAAKLIQIFGTALAAVDACLAAEPEEATKKLLEQVPPNVIATVRRCGAAPAIRCAELATIRTNAPIDCASIEAPTPTSRPSPAAASKPEPKGSTMSTAPTTAQPTGTPKSASKAPIKGPRVPVITRRRKTAFMKSILTGRSGIGKTAFVGSIPNVFIIPVEEGLEGVLPDDEPGHFEDEDQPQNFDQLMRLIDCFMAQNPPGEDGTRPWRFLAIDSLTGVEKLVNAAAMAKHDVSDMEGKEYKAVWSTAYELWQRFQAKLDAVRRAGVNVWLIAHAAEILEAVPETGATYRRWDIEFRGTSKTLGELKLLWRSWANDVFFLEWAAEVHKGGKGYRAIGKLKGRVLITRETGTHYAKTRYRVPPVLPATWPDLSRAIRAGIPAPEPKLRAEIESLLPRLGDERGEIETALAGATGANALAALLSRVQGLIAVSEDDTAPDGEPSAQEGDVS